MTIQASSSSSLLARMSVFDPVSDLRSLDPDCLRGVLIQFIRPTSHQTLVRDVVAETECTTEQAQEAIQWSIDHHSVLVFGSAPYCIPQLRNFDILPMQPVHRKVYELLFYPVCGTISSPCDLYVLQKLICAKAVNMTGKLPGVVFELDWAGMPDLTRTLVSDALKEAKDILK